MINKIYTKKGFTLVELLVVVSIIGILVGIATINLRNTGSRSRDARRKADLVMVRDAMNLYAIDNKGVYPTALHQNRTGYGYGTCSQSTTLEHAYENWTDLQTKLHTYIQDGYLPIDPLRKCSSPQLVGTVNNDSKIDYAFMISDTATRYCFMSALENANDPDRNGPTAPRKYSNLYCAPTEDRYFAVGTQ